MFRAIIDAFSALWASLIAPIFVAGFAVWLTLRAKAKLRVSIFACLGDRAFADLVALYLERVPDYERVPPDHFKAFFNCEYVASSHRDFRRRVAANVLPAHLLITARVSGDTVGFLKAIFIPGLRTLFIAYLVASKDRQYAERQIATRLLTKLFETSRDSAVSSIIFEICSGAQGTEEDSKQRLFRHHARLHGIQVFRLDGPYSQPEICDFTDGPCGTTPAHLYIAPITQSFNRNAMTFDEYRELVSGIFKYVYLASFTQAEPRLNERYRDFLSEVSDRLFANPQPQNITLS
jgi:hypothetical protein